MRGHASSNTACGTLVSHMCFLGVGVTFLDALGRWVVYDAGELSCGEAGLAGSCLTGEAVRLIEVIDHKFVVFLSSKKGKKLEKKSKLITYWCIL